MILADSWYSSGTFWAIAAVAVALLVGIVGSWVVWRAANPRRRLVYAMPSVSRLVNKSRIVGSLEVRRNGTVLSDPYLVTVTLANHGRFDISKGAFENTPLRFDLDTTILEVLDVSTEPPGLKAPDTAWTGATLLVGPDKIGKGQRVTFALLVDGDKPKLSRLDNPLIDVELRQDREGDVARARQWRAATLTAGIVAVGAIAGAALFKVVPTIPTTPTASFIKPLDTTKVSGTVPVQIRLTNPPPEGQGAIWLVLEPLSDDHGAAISPTSLDYLTTTKTSLEDDSPNIVNGVWTNAVQIGTPGVCQSVAVESLYVVLVDAAQDKTLIKDAAADEPLSSLPGTVLKQINVQRNGKNC